MRFKILRPDDGARQRRADVLVAAYIKVLIVAAIVTIVRWR